MGFTVVFNRAIFMSHKIIEAASGFGVSLSSSDGERVNAFLGIKDKRKNLSDEQKLILQQVCQLMSRGESVEGAIALVGSTDSSESTSESVVDLSAKSEPVDEPDLNLIIESQANRAADAAMMSLPNLASAEIEGIRAAFIRQFRKRIRERLQSVEFQSAFVTTINGQGQLSATDTTSNTVLAAGLSDEG